MSPSTRPAGWLFKTEPSTYSWDDLVREKRATWDGVKNPQALANLRLARKGDPVLVYHTGDEKAVIGLARIAREAYPDPKARDERLVVVEIEAIKPLPGQVTLAAVKARKDLATFPLVRLPRLSVMPVSESEWRAILEMAGE